LSPFGVADLLGNCWQYTSVFADTHTRRVILKGGSNYKPTIQGGHDWYFPQARNLSQHQVMLLMGDSFERAGTVSFRCVLDTFEGSVPRDR